MMKTAAQQQTEEEVESAPKEEKDIVPPFGTLNWIHYWSQFEGQLPSPIDVSITGSMVYLCPELKWYNFDVYPHKIKLTNTGYTLLLGAKWKTERPYLEGGCLREKHVLSQMHFHWGADMTEGSDHTVDKRRHPGELQVIFFRSEYMTQEEALHHSDGVVVVCYIIKYGVNPDIRLARIIEGFRRVQESKTQTRIGPYPMSQLIPMFYEDYFLYWGNLTTARGESHTVRWLVPRITLFASFDQVIFFRSEYMTQEEALHHSDGVVVVCYIIKYGVNPDIRLARIIEGFRRVQESKTQTRIGPYPMSQLIPMFYEDYFLYWGNLTTARGESHTVRWLVPRITLFASFDQMKEFRKLWDPWDEPNRGNFRPLQERGERHVWFINPHWNQYNSTLPIPRVPELSISELSPEYKKNMWMLPKQNEYMIIAMEEEQNKENEKNTET